MASLQGASITQVLSDLPDTPITTTRERTWAGVTLDMHAYAPKYHVVAPARDHHLVLYTPHGTGRMFQRRAGREHLSVIGPGSVILMPAGLDSLWDGTATATARIRVPLDLMTRVGGEIDGRRDRSVELRNTFETHDPVIERIALILSGELEAPPHPAQALLVGSASAALASHLVRSYDAFSSVEKTPGKLPVRALAAVVDFIESSSDRVITLDELAAIAGVSRFHFSRVFKRTTGTTPLAFVEQSRIRKAQTLMQRGVASLSDLSLIVGFADQSHFTRRFRRHTGVTPAVYMRSLL